MPDGGDSIEVRVIEAIGSLDPAAWDACAGAINPFVSHAFLSALEDSGSASAETGWLPHHLAIERAGVLVGAVPLYLKNHSYGEYVFDWGWADAFERAGGSYYPKLQSSVPFCPVPGPRLLVRPGTDAETIADALARALPMVGERTRASSVHVTFCSEADQRRLVAGGMLARAGHQYHWPNRDYEDFEAFLATLTARKRKAIRKERRAAAASGLTIETLEGEALNETHWDAFFDFYSDTSDRKWGQSYLNREFFSLLGERLGERVALVIARDGARPVAGALNLVGSEAIYGRNWGCLEEHKFLHFELCYYRAIDYAIEHGLARVEAGAQGPHKIQRGYLPSPTYSAHWIGEPNFRDAVATFLRHEARDNAMEMAAAAAYSPYRQGEPDAPGSGSG